MRIVSKIELRIQKNPSSFQTEMSKNKVNKESFFSYGKKLSKDLINLFNFISIK